MRDLERLLTGAYPEGLRDVPPAPVRKSAVRDKTFEKLGLEDQRPVKYLVVCQSCGRQLPRMKRSPLVEHPERYRCSCGGALRVVEVHEDPRP